MTGKKVFCDCSGGTDMFGVYIDNIPDDCYIEIDDTGHYYNVIIKKRE